MDNQAAGGVTEVRKAKLGRDLLLAEVRQLEALARGRERYSQEAAERWQEAMRDEEDKAFIRDLIYDEAQKAPQETREVFQKVALASSPSLQSAVSAYLLDRREGNPFGYKPISASSANELSTAVNHLVSFLEGEPETVFLDEVTPDQAQAFRGDYLGNLTSARGKPLATASIDKSLTLLRGLWRWAIAHKKTDNGLNPFDFPKGLPRAKRKSDKQRTMFSPEQAVKVCQHVGAGDRMGALFRLGLVTGARLSEIAKLTVDQVREDGLAFTLDTGKTDNAARVVPVPAVVRPLLLERLRSATEKGEERLFHDFPISPSTGNVKSASQAFSRVRNDLFGKAAGSTLDFHSLRHAWRTMARRAGLSVDDTHDIGGWASVSKTSDPYDHGLDLEDLLKAQERIAAKLEAEGYLKGL